jgi:hypothetical protein
MWTVSIDCNTTVSCRTPGAALTAYRMAEHWKTRGHDVALTRAGVRAIPGSPWTARSTHMELNLTAPQWHGQAACRNLGNADKIFFPVRSVEESVGVGDAKRYCDVCPVLYHCLKAAFDGNELGVWGGMTYVERTVLRNNGLKPEHFATPEALRDYLEDVKPLCSGCGRHRKEKDDSGMCSECFYADLRAQRAAAKKAVEAPVCVGWGTDTDCGAPVYARGRCNRHYGKLLRAKNKAEGKTRVRRHKPTTVLPDIATIAPAASQGGA